MEYSSGRFFVSALICFFLDLITATFNHGWFSLLLLWLIVMQLLHGDLSRPGVLRFSLFLLVVQEGIRYQLIGPSLLLMIPLISLVMHVRHMMLYQGPAVTIALFALIAFLAEGLIPLLAFGHIILFTRLFFQIFATLVMGYAILGCVSGSRLFLSSWQK